MSVSKGQIVEEAKKEQTVSLNKLSLLKLVGNAYKLLSELSFVMAGAAIGVAVMSLYKQPKVVAFDLKATTESFLQQLQHSSLDEQSKNNTVKRFELAINRVMAEYETDNTVVLVKAAVVSSVPDKTSEIKKKIAQRMKQGE